MYKYISIISLFFMLLVLGEAEVGISPEQLKKEITISQGSISEKIRSQIQLKSQRCSKGDTLYQDKYLLPGQQLFSNGYSGAMQHDGNFVIYVSNRPIWSTGTSGTSGEKFFMQADGNLVIYNMQRKPIWASNTAGKGIPPYRLVMQTDRNLVIYDGKDRPIWATGTNLRLI